MLFFKSKLVQGHWKWIIMILRMRMFGLFSINKALIHAVASEILVKSSLCVLQVHLIYIAYLLFVLDCSPQEFLKWLKSFLLVTRMSEDKLHHIFHKVRLKPLAVAKFVWFVKNWVNTYCFPTITFFGHSAGSCSYCGKRKSGVYLH